MTILQVIWFILIAVLWTGYLVLEGFGVGAGMVMPMVAKTDRERTQVQKTFGPVWDGNEVSDRRRRNFRGLPGMVRHHVLRNVPGAVPDSVLLNRSYLCD